MEDIYRFKLFVIIHLIIWLSYSLINSLADSLQPHQLSFVLDSIIPYLPSTAYIYLLHVPYVGLSFFLLKEEKVFIEALTSIILCVAFSCTIFLIFPLSYARPDTVLEGSGSFLMYLIHLFDRPTNTLPSLHVSMVFTLYFYVKEVLGKKGGLVAFFLAILISLSTLTTKQHYIIDVLSGFALAVVFYGLVKKYPNNFVVSKIGDLKRKLL